MTFAPAASALPSRYVSHHIVSRRNAALDINMRAAQETVVTLKQQSTIDGTHAETSIANTCLSVISATYGISTMGTIGKSAPIDISPRGGKLASVNRVLTVCT